MARAEIEFANGECERMFGYGPGELAGENVENLMPEHLRPAHRGHRAGFAAAPAKRMMGIGRDLVALRRDGSEFFIEVGLTPIEAASGSKVVAFAIDVSARRDSEYALRRAMSELEMANENLARFAYVASHDIQEPLRKISAFADILNEAMAKDDREEALYAADVMASSALHARRLVADLLAYARAAHQSHAVEPISIRAALERALEALSLTIVETKAEIAWTGEDFPVEADRLQLHQLLQNILSNALKYHKPKLPPQVSIHLEPGNPRTASPSRIAASDSPRPTPKPFSSPSAVCTDAANIPAPESASRSARPWRSGMAGAWPPPPRQPSARPSRSSFLSPPTPGGARSCDLNSTGAKIRPRPGGFSRHDVSAGCGAILRKPSGGENSRATPAQSRTRRQGPPML